MPRWRPGLTFGEFAELTMREYYPPAAPAAEGPAVAQGAEGQPPPATQPDAPAAGGPAWQTAAPLQPVAHPVGLGAPEQRSLSSDGLYMLDMHGFFDLASASYRDAVMATYTEAGRLLSEPEFLLGSSYALWRALLESKSYRGLSAEETSAVVYLRGALPDRYPVTGELAEYLSHLGTFTAANGVQVSPDFVLPRCAGAGTAGTTEPVGSWSCTHQPLFHSLALARLSGNHTDPRGALVVAPGAVDPFINSGRDSTMPGAFRYDGPARCRVEAVAGRYRPIVGPSEEARFQVHPDLLADYIGFIKTLESSQRTARVAFSRGGSQAQEVVSLPTNYTDGQREIGSRFESESLLPVGLIEAGRLFRYQRMTPVELTYSGLAADANWAYERSYARKLGV